MKKIICMFLALCFTVSLMSGCGVNTSKGPEGTVTISVGNWPPDSKPEILALYENDVAKMKAKYPHIIIEPDQWTYGMNTFLTKASSGQLPTLYSTFFTETDKIIDAGFAADLTPFMEKYGYKDALNPYVMDLMSKNGKIYGIPTNAYAMGIMCNVNLFRDAGELDENGVPNFPKTFEELAELAVRIKEKTGQAGFIFPTMETSGGYHFLDLAWNFGVDFMKNEGGKWISTFDSPEAIEALQYLKDLKWKYNVLPDNTFIDMAEMRKTFAADQGAMYLGNAPQRDLVNVYKMDRNDIACAPMPSGKNHHYTLMGGNLEFVSPTATQEQIEAVFLWEEMHGRTPAVTEDTITAWNDEYKNDSDNGFIVGTVAYPIWVNQERLDKQQEVISKYTNVNLDMFKEFMKYEVPIRPEEPVNCRELYSILSSVVQAVLSDKNADCAALIKKANSDFQKNYLDNAEE